MKTLIALIASLIFLANVKAQNSPGIFVKNVSNPVISLNGTWKICLTPPANFQELVQFDGIWKDIQVPGECMMQGFSIKHDQPFLYKKEFNVPADYKGKVIKLRFEGVYSYARIWINGKYVRDHSGGFTAWECDITPFVIPGKTAALTVEVKDKADEISYASGYAKHPIGGILRNVSLLALPLNYPEKVVITTDFDEDYRNNTLKVSGVIKNPNNNRKIQIELFDKENAKIPLANDVLHIRDSIFEVSNLVKNPLKWDAEHPNLYRLKVSFMENGTLTWYNNYFFGFREIEVKGNRFLVNGQQVKLRGACRHDIHPLLGRVSTPEYELKDLLLAKEANINFIRTSHYPPTDNFLQLCDKYGIYVEEETAVCFVNTYRSPEYAPGSTENSPDYTARYLSQLKEMVENHRNYPSVIIWSIGNENKFGANFQESYEWVKKTDPTRPAIFSFPGTFKGNEKPYDILSMHYPNIDGSLEQYGISVKGFGNVEMPVLFDEWAHVPCYNSSTIREDPNVRDFWGMSIDSMWQKTYDADGGLGGAIWGMIDETFMLPDTTVGYGEWGIVDTWRRKKPEFWNVKKAYSPVRILKTEFPDYESNGSLEIPVYNRFDFTNLNELTLRYTYKGTTHTLEATDIPAHNKGIINLPIKEWSVKEPLKIEFIDSNRQLVDCYIIQKHDGKPSVKSSPIGKINLTEDAKKYTVICENNLTLNIDKSTGLFSSYELTGKEFGFSGPWLNYRTKAKGNQTSSTQFKEYGIGWKLRNISTAKKDNSVEVSIKGDYESLHDVGFNILIYPDGSMITTYSLNNLSKEYIREMGIKFVLEDKFDSLSWKRDGYWSFYPADHLSASEGRISLYSDKQNVYRRAPIKEWQYDTKSFFYDEKKNEEANQLTYIAKATKENILEYSLLNNGSGSFYVSCTGKVGCRISKKDNMIELFINNLWDYPDLAWGNYQRNIFLGNNYLGRIEAIIKSK
jgi:beta-galactosidase